MAKKRASRKKAARDSARKSTGKSVTRKRRRVGARKAAPRTPHMAATAGVVLAAPQPSPVMLAELEEVLARHGWEGSAAVVRPADAVAAAGLTCPPGQCPSVVSIPGPNGTTINVPICRPC
jgi:hypothetical protein